MPYRDHDSRVLQQLLFLAGDRNFNFPAFSALITGINYGQQRVVLKLNDVKKLATCTCAGTGVKQVIRLAYRCRGKLPEVHQSPARLHVNVASRDDLKGISVRQASPVHGRIQRGDIVHLYSP